MKIVRTERLDDIPNRTDYLFYLEDKEDPINIVYDSTDKDVARNPRDPMKLRCHTRCTCYLNLNIKQREKACRKVTPHLPRCAQMNEEIRSILLLELL